ncbi:MAG: glutamine-hydrolyzing GMP synthase [Candidatus Helarchaeota archaeon]
MINEDIEIIILDFGGQYVFNFKRILYELGINSAIVPYNISAAEILEMNIKGIILSGGPYSVYLPGAPMPDPKIYDLNIPILGICYGNQLMAHQLGGKVIKGGTGEFGFTLLNIIDLDDPLFENIKEKSICWMSHSDLVSIPPKNFKIIAKTPQTEIAGIKSLDRPIYGLQWHVEVTHSEEGYNILKNFVYNVCKCKKKEWDVELFIKKSMQSIKQIINNKTAICAVSGGVDSSTVAVLVNNILGPERLHCIHINNGMMRINESEQVIKLYKELGLNIKYIDATEIFLKNLKGITGSDKKRKIIGKTFIDIFEKEASKIKAEFLIQATIMPDIIESTRGEAKKIKGKKHGGVIKIHHNVGGLPEKMGLKVVEPIKDLFKYQVRVLARKLDLPTEISERQPQPGPAGAVRILGEITHEKIKLWQIANQITENILKPLSPAQYFAVLLPNEYIKDNKIALKAMEIITQFFDNNNQCSIIPYIFKAPSIGVKGDERVYGNTLGIKIVKDNLNLWYDLEPLDILNLQGKITGNIQKIVRVAALLSDNIDHSKPYSILVRSVETKDFMTATPTILSKKYLLQLKNELSKINEIGAVFYDYSTKPSATIEYI